MNKGLYSEPFELWTGNHSSKSESTGQLSGTTELPETITLNGRGFISSDMAYKNRNLLLVSGFMGLRTKRIKQMSKVLIKLILLQISHYL